MAMQRYFGAGTLLVLVGMVFVRVLLMRKRGIKAMKFGEIDKKDFLIPPFALFYFYIVVAAALNLPTIRKKEFFRSGVVSWVGMILCLAGVVLLFLSLISFGKNFRVGIDKNQPDKLVTTGVFAFSRNPIYVAFWFALVGEFLLFSNWILLTYVIAAMWLFHRQVVREEVYLQEHYGQQYVEYSRRVRRYF